MCSECLIPKARKSGYFRSRSLYTFLNLPVHFQNNIKVILHISPDLWHVTWSKINIIIYGQTFVCPSIFQQNALPLRIGRINYFLFPILWVVGVLPLYYQCYKSKTTIYCISMIKPCILKPKCHKINAMNWKIGLEVSHCL